MKKNNKRGFTLVELLVVIAILAILATVTVVGYISFTNKAKESVDEQAITQINNVLAADEVLDKPNNISDVIQFLSENGLSIENYKPLVDGNRFYWDMELNRVLYVDENNSVLFPNEYIDHAYEIGKWFSLNGEIKEDTSWREEIDDSGNVTISTGSQLISIMSDFNNNNSIVNNVNKITLSEDIDLMGASNKFKKTIGSDNFNQNLEIDGHGHSIYGFRDDNNTIFGQGEFQNKGYGYGLFYSIGKDATITLKNLTFANMVVEDTISDNGTMGLIAGYVYGTLNIENVTIKDSIVSGCQKIGGIVGQLKGTLTLNNVAMENVVVEASYQGAKLIGWIDFVSEGINSNFTYSNCDFSSVIVKTNDYPTPEEYLSSWNVTEHFSNINGVKGLYLNTKYGICLGYSDALYCYTAKDKKSGIVLINGNEYKLDYDSFFGSTNINKDTALNGSDF